MSATPITDAAFDAMQEIPKDLWALRESMRNLERQRNELLKALESIVADDDQSAKEIGLEDYEHPSTAKARAAIAKAKGEAP